MSTELQGTPASARWALVTLALLDAAAALVLARASLMPVAVGFLVALVSRRSAAASSGEASPRS